jgi:hypothetical protein
MSQSQIETPLFQVPSFKTEPIIQNAIINFHDRKVGVPDCLIPHDNLDQYIGIIKLRIRGEIPITKEIHIDYAIDKSGSMLDSCKDGKTKIQHIKFALQNMLQIFHQKIESNISVRIQSFNDNVYTVIETVEDIKSKTEEELNEIITKINEITPEKSTNIEKTLKATNKYLNPYIREHHSKRVAHILLTDGEITNGSTNKSYLKGLINNDYPNIFLGYGLQHDNLLLTSLETAGKYNEYRFVDNLEKSGLVYGEVIHKLLYTAIEDVTLKAENCEIYDYSTNTWTTTLNIGHLISDQEKIYQIRSLKPNEAHIAVYGRTIHQTRQLDMLTNEIELQIHATPVIISSVPCDLTNYLFRQKTQELLFKTKEHLQNSEANDPLDKYKSVLIESKKVNKKTDDLKKEIKDFFKSMLDYIEANKLKEDEFFRMLCDDIYIAIKSFDMENGLMFTAARHKSQGRQQSYTPRFEETKLDTDPSLVPTTALKRGYTLGERAEPRQSPVLETTKVTKDELDLNYQLSQNDISPYSSIGQVKLMRDVSYTQPIQEVTEDLNTP